MAYTGISQRAVVASLQSDLSNAANQLKMYQVDNGAYPSSELDCNPTPAANTICLKSSSNNSYEYTRPTSQTFTLIAKNGSICYSITENSGPVAASCSYSAFGNGNDGSVTVAINRNINTETIAGGRSCADAVNYSVTALTANTAMLPSNPAGDCLANGDEVLLINLQGISTNYNNVGNYETLRIQSISANTITFTANKTKYYGNGASDDTNIGTATSNQRVMLQRVPNYTNVTINSGITLTASAWDGTKGGVLSFKASGTLTNSGIISANSLGYRGGASSPDHVSGGTWGMVGEMTSGYGTYQQAGILGGGGGGQTSVFADGSSGGGGGAGGSYGTAGANGLSPSATYGTMTYGGYAGTAYGVSNLSNTYLGSGGGAGGSNWDWGSGYAGAPGGGIVFFTSISLLLAVYNQTEVWAIRVVRLSVVLVVVLVEVLYFMAML